MVFKIYYNKRLGRVYKWGYFFQKVDVLYCSDCIFSGYFLFALCHECFVKTDKINHRAKR